MDKFCDAVWDDIFQLNMWKTIYVNLKPGSKAFVHQKSSHHVRSIRNRIKDQQILTGHTCPRRRRRQEKTVSGELTKLVRKTGNLNLGFVAE